MARPGCSRCRCVRVSERTVLNLLCLRCHEPSLCPALGDSVARTQASDMEGREQWLAEIRAVLADQQQQLVGRRTIAHIIGSQWVQTPRHGEAISDA
jgi:hypothetical protein